MACTVGVCKQVLGQKGKPKKTVAAFEENRHKKNVLFGCACMLVILLEPAGYHSFCVSTLL